MTVTIPAAMVENQLDGLINELRGHLQAQGVSLEQYLEMGNTTMEQLRDHAREQAAAAARYELAMTEIARREGIDIPRRTWTPSTPSCPGSTACPWSCCASSCRPCACATT